MAFDRWYVPGTIGVGCAFDELSDAQGVAWATIGSAIRHSGWEALNLLDSRPAAAGQGPNLNWWSLNAGNKTVRLGAISSRLVATADAGSSGYMAFYTKPSNSDVAEALRLTEQQAVSVPKTLTVGPLTAGAITGRIEASGYSAEISFLRRSLSAWPAAAAAGDRFLWYNPDGSARLFTDAVGDLLTVRTNGEATFTGPLNVPHVLQWFHQGPGGGRSGWIGYGGGATDLSLTLTNDKGRLHIAGAELLYLLNRSGVIIGKEWGGNGNLVVQGRIGAGGQPPEPRTGGWGGGIHTWDLEAEGTIWSRNGYQSGNRDVAENYHSEESLERGDVVSLDPAADKIVRSTSACDPLVIGIVSTAPAVHLGAGPDVKTDREYPVALCGRVPCKVTDENGPIRRGDLLTAGTTPGHAMKAVAAPVNGRLRHTPGTIIGKALEPHAQGAGLIEVFVFSS